MTHEPIDEEKLDASTKLSEMRKSSRDKRIAGICGGFGEYTPVPSWLWRAISLSTLFFGGPGLFAYIVQWTFMPPANTPE